MDNQHIQQVIGEAKIFIGGGNWQDERTTLIKRLTATLEASQARAVKMEKAFDNADRNYLKQQKLAADRGREIERLQIALHTHQSCDKSAAELYVEADRWKRLYEALVQSIKDGLGEFPPAKSAESLVAWIESTCPFVGDLREHPTDA